MTDKITTQGRVSNLDVDLSGLITVTVNVGELQTIGERRFQGTIYISISPDEARDWPLGKWVTVTVEIP